MGDSIACNVVGSSVFTDQEGKTFYMEYQAKDLSVKLGDCVRIKLEANGLKGADEFAIGQILAIYMDKESDYYIEVRWFVSTRNLSSKNKAIVAPQENELIELVGYAEDCSAGSVTEIVDIQGIGPNKRLSSAYFICRFMMSIRSSLLTKVSPHGILKRGRKMSKYAYAYASHFKAQDSVLSSVKRERSDSDETERSVRHCPSAASVPGAVQPILPAHHTESGSSGSSSGTTIGRTNSSSASGAVAVSSNTRSSSSSSSSVAATSSSAAPHEEGDIPVTNIYLGIYRFGTGNGNTSDDSTDRSLFIRVDSDKCILSSRCRISGESLEIEELTNIHIKKIVCAPVNSETSQCFISIEVLVALKLRSVDIGVKCMLHPNLHANSKNSSMSCAKNILIMLDKEGMDKFYDACVRLSKKKTRDMNVEYYFSITAAGSSWMKEYISAHLHSGLHSVGELRSRAKSETDAKQARELRRLKRKPPVVSISGGEKNRDSDFGHGVSSGATTTVLPQPPLSVEATQIAVPALAPAHVPINATVPMPAPAQARVDTHEPTTALMPSLPLPPSISSEREYAVWQAKRDKDIAEIKNTLRDKELCALLSQSEIDLLKNRLVQLMLQ